MSCNQPSLGRQTMEAAVGAPLPTAAVPDLSSPALFVSNAPEQVGSGDYPLDPDFPVGAWQFGAGPYNLCEASLISAFPNRVRVFFWHVCRFTVPSYWGLIVASTNGSTISNLRIQVPTNANPMTDLSAPGCCLAASHLFGTLDTPNVTNMDISNDTVIWSAAIDAGTLVSTAFTVVAAIIEFDVQALGFLSIRSAVSLTGQASADFTHPTIPTPLADNQNNFGKFNVRHNRGYWEHSDISMSLPGELDCTLQMEPPQSKEWGICDVGGPEENYFSVLNSRAQQRKETNPDGTKKNMERPNTAAYGANLKYIGAYHNVSTTDPGFVYVGLHARGVGHPYFGAAKVKTISPVPSISGAFRKVPALPPSNALNNRFTDLTSVFPSANPTGYIAVAPSGTGTVAISLANGGGATLPVNIQLKREMLWDTGVGEPG